MPEPTIILHGGAGAIQARTWPQYQKGTNAAAQVAQDMLVNGAPALDAAIHAVRLMEDNPTFNAGHGSSINRNGIVQCDALVMTDEFESGAVASVSGVPNPVELARVVLESTPHMLIVGHDAKSLATEHGTPTCDPQDLITPDRLKRYNEMRERQIAFGDDPEFEATDNPLDDIGEDLRDTVGALALDSYGRLAAASSTGGIMMKLPGRAGDTPAVGCGTYCGPAGAVTCTGHGEAAMRVCLAKHAYMFLDSGDCAESAANQAIEYLVKHTGGRVGILVLDKSGNRAWCTSTPRIAVGVPERLLDATSGVLPAVCNRNR